MLRNSIRARLVVAVLLTQIVLAVGMVSTGVIYTKRRLRASIDASLQARATSVAALVRYTEGDEYHLYFDSSLVPKPLDRNFSDLYEIHAADGALVAHSPGWPPDATTVPPGKRNPWNLWIAGVPYRAIRLSSVPVLDREENVTPSTLTVFYAVPTVKMNRELLSAAILLAVVSAGLVLFTGLIGWFAIRRSLLPLMELADNAKLVSTRDWNLRAPEIETTPSELLPLVTAMQAMLGKLEQAFRQQREFVADAAHELKTPVTILKSSLQALLQKHRSAEEYRTGIEESLDDVDRLERLIKDLLRLARAEQWSSGAMVRELAAVEVSETCERALIRLRGLAKQNQVSLQFVHNGSMFVRADAEDLELVWTNLLENAVHYSPSSGTVSIKVEAVTPDLGRVTVADQGIGIPEGELPNIFDRFYRGDPSRARDTGGFGLGLAIAKALVESYGGRMRAESTPGTGTRIFVELPIEKNVPSRTLHVEEIIG